MTPRGAVGVSEDGDIGGAAQLEFDPPSAGCRESHRPFRARGRPHCLRHSPACVHALPSVTMSQLTFPTWWSASLEIPPGDEDKVAALFRGAAIRSAALSLVATAVCATVCALGLRFRSG